MGFFSSEPRHIKLSNDESLIRAFRIAAIDMGRVYEKRPRDLTSSVDFEQNALLDSAMLTWRILQKAAASTFNSHLSYEQAQQVAIASIEVEILKPAMENNLEKVVSETKTSSRTSDELLQSLKSIRSFAAYESGYASIKNPLFGYPEEIANKAHREAMLKSFIWLPCFLNDFSIDWNSQKSCSKNEHSWPEECKNWKSSELDNNFFKYTIGLAMASYVYEPIYAGASGNETANFLNTSEVCNTGLAFLVEALLQFKKCNSIFPSYPSINP